MSLSSRNIYREIKDDIHSVLAFLYLFWRHVNKLSLSSRVCHLAETLELYPLLYASKATLHNTLDNTLRNSLRNPSNTEDSHIRESKVTFVTLSGALVRENGEGLLGFCRCHCSSNSSSSWLRLGSHVRSSWP